MGISYEKAKEKLKENNQEHLVLHFDTLSEEKKKELLEQIEKLDFKQIELLFSRIKNKEATQNFDIQPIDYIDKQRITEGLKSKYEKLGEKAIRDGKLAVITMAGGQGTRLRT